MRLTKIQIAHMTAVAFNSLLLLTTANQADNSEVFESEDFHRNVETFASLM